MRLRGGRVCRNEERVFFAKRKLIITKISNQFERRLRRVRSVLKNDFSFAQSAGLSRERVIVLL
jgi:hypothetical protein